MVGTKLNMWQSQIELNIILSHISSASSLMYSSTELSLRVGYFIDEWVSVASMEQAQALSLVGAR